MWALAVSLCLIPPVSGPVERPYVAPACRFCPGNQAVDFAAELGETVVAPVSGTIRFVGVVAGTGYVTVEVVAPTTSRRLVTVGGLTSLPASLARGRVISQGGRLGMAAGTTVSLSLREITSAGDEIYVDPGAHLGQLRRRRARLVSRDFHLASGGSRRGVCALTR